MKQFDFSSQKGFTSLGLFLAILMLLILMSATGYFIPPKSVVDDTGTYSASGVNGEQDKQGLQMFDLIFPSPTELPTPVPDISTPTPIPPAGPTATPTPTPTPTPIGFGPTATPIPTATPTPPLDEI